MAEQQHPLTWETITEEIASSEDIDDYGWYHFNPDHLRAATDWQLEQVIEWLRNCRDYDLFYIKDRALMRRELKRAMRPTTQEKKND